MTAQQTSIAQIQAVLGVKADGAWGPISQGAFDRLIHGEPPLQPGEHAVKASSFADPADVAAFRRCKAAGGSDEECFKVGDNGEGYWGDDCSGPVAMCALPPEDMEERFGSVDGAKHARVLVKANGRQVLCELADRMPHRAHITNGAGLDLNPGALLGLALKPPVLVPATWSWA